MAWACQRAKEPCGYAATAVNPATCRYTPSCAPTAGLARRAARLARHRPRAAAQPPRAALSVRGASDIIRGIAADANLDEEHITARIGRHTFATTQVRGTGLVTVADMLGHARLDAVRLYTTPPPPSANEPSISCHTTVDQPGGGLMFGGRLIGRNDPGYQEKVIKFSELLASCVMYSTALDVTGAASDLVGAGTASILTIWLPSPRT